MVRMFALISLILTIFQVLALIGYLGNPVGDVSFILVTVLSLPTLSLWGLTITMSLTPRLDPRKQNKWDHF